MNVFLDENPLWGDGSDGDHTLTGNETITADKQYQTLDLAGFALNGLFVIRCWRLINTGGAASIHANGPSATAGTAGTWGGNGSCGTGGNGAGGGGAGGGNGSTAAGVTECWPATVPGGTAGDGGAGGASGGGQTGGAGGATTAVAATRGWGGMQAVDSGRAPDATLLRGGSGGGGGGSQAGVGSAGGAGGAGGGVRKVLARALGPGADDITISANGGNGGNASGAAGAGGGGGGGGGAASFIYGFVEAGGGIPTVTATGGAGGTAVGAGSNGVDGQDGDTETIQVQGGRTVSSFRQETQPWNAIALICDIVVDGAGVTGLTVTGTLKRKSDGQWLQSAGGWGASPSNLTLSAVDATNLAGVYRYVPAAADLISGEEGYIAKITESTYSLVEYVLITPTGTADDARRMLALRQNNVRVLASAWDSTSKQPTAATVWIYATAADAAADTVPDGTGAIGEYEIEATFSSGQLTEYLSSKVS